MKRFKRVAFFAGGATKESPALRRAIELARRNGARLRIIDVVDEPPRVARPLLKQLGIPDVANALIDYREAELAGIVARATNEETKVSVKVRSGTDFIEAIKEVVRGRDDLLVTSEPWEGDEQTKHLGSTNFHLLRKCPKPVWVVAGARRRKYARVLAAIDPGDKPREREELNGRILTLAASQAALEGAELHVVNVWSLYGEGQFRHGFGRLPASEVDALLAETKDRHRQWMEDEIAKHTPNQERLRTHLVKGAAKDVLPDLIARKRIDLAVMGSVGRTGVPGLFIGNTAESVLSNIQCSVLAVKPKRFKTPVTA